MLEVTQKNLDYADKIIAKVYGFAPDYVLYNDVQSIAYEAVMRAVRNFDETKNTKLSTLIYKYITFAVNKFLQKKYVKEFTHSYNNYYEPSYLDDTLFHLENKEKVKLVLDKVAKKFSKKEVKMLSSWVAGDTIDTIRKKYNTSKNSAHRLLTKMLKEIEKCSEM